MADTPTDPTKANEPGDPGVTPPPTPGSPEVVAGAAPQPPNPAPSPPPIGGSEPASPPISGVTPSSEPTTSIPNPAEPEQPTPPSDPTNPVPAPDPAPQSGAAVTPTPPMSSAEVGPPWLRTDPNVRAAQDSAGGGAGVPDLAPNAPDADAPPPWQQQQGADVTESTEEEPKEGHFPVVIFVILVLGIIVAIGVFLFTQGVLPF